MTGLSDSHVNQAHIVYASVGPLSLSSSDLVCIALLRRDEPVVDEFAMTSSCVEILAAVAKAYTELPEFLELKERRPAHAKRDYSIRYMDIVDGHVRTTSVQAASISEALFVSGLRLYTEEDRNEIIGIELETATRQP